MNSRYIPKKISNQVQKKHYFECAWCGTTITDRHHIEEFAEGGKHTVENLILLCPNCHRQTHNHEISKVELKHRINTHLEGDRFGGNINLQINNRKVIAGGATFIDVPILIRIQETNIIEFQKMKNGKFTIKTRFYDPDGNLIFWLSNNRFWTATPFIVTSERNSLFIKARNTPQYLDIRLKDDFIEIKGINFYNGNILHFTDKYLDINSNKFSSIGLEGGSVGINIG